MPAHRRKHKPTLYEQYPPSPPCSCPICVAYCARPGWWSVAEVTRAVKAGYGPRMMLEIAPELTFGVLSPAFKGCEGGIAANEYASAGCTFFHRERCELFGTGYQPLECRYCHHDRPGKGQACHAGLEADWRTHAGRRVIRQWCAITQIGQRYDLSGLPWLAPLASGR